MHQTLAYLPVVILVGAVSLDVWRALATGAGAGVWAGRLVAVGAGLAALVAFTGLAAYRDLDARMAGPPAAADAHALWAVVLLLPLLGLAVWRVRSIPADGGRRPWLPAVVDAGLALFALTITVIGAGIR